MSTTGILKPICSKCEEPVSDPSLIVYDNTLLILCSFPRVCSSFDMVEGLCRCGYPSAKESGWCGKCLHISITEIRNLVHALEWGKSRQYKGR